MIFDKCRRREFETRSRGDDVARRYALLRSFLRRCFPIFLLFACFAVESFAQDALPAVTQEQTDWLPVAVYLKKQLETGNIEQKRDVLFQIRNHRSEQASRLTIPALTDSNEIVRATAAASVIYLPADESSDLLIPLS